MLALFFSTNLVFTQNKQQSLIKISHNPTDRAFWWLEKNNYGKSTISNEIEYRWTLKKPKTIYQLSFSNAYKSYTSEYPIRYVGLVKYNIRHRLLLGESFIK